MTTVSTDSITDKEAEVYLKSLMDNEENKIDYHFGVLLKFDVCVGIESLMDYFGSCFNKSQTVRYTNGNGHVTHTHPILNLPPNHPILNHNPSHTVR